MAVDQLERPAVDQRPTYRHNRVPVTVAAFAAVLAIGIGWGVSVSLAADEPTVELSSVHRPATPITAVLGAHPGTQAYFTRTADDFDSAVMGIGPGEVSAEWYRAEGFFVVFFAGVDTATAPGLCPAAYVLAGGQPDFMANAPAAGADCSAIVVDELPNPGVRTLECNGSLALLTAIPESTNGMFHAVLERPAPTSSGGTGIMGLLGMRPDGRAEVPEVDLSIFEC